MKRIFKPMQGILLPVIYLLFAIGCTKNVSETNISDAFGNSPKDYLVLQNGEEFDELISKVSIMSDSAYDAWKSEVGLKHSLYDNFVETAKNIELLKAEEEKKGIVDTNFFYFKNDMVYSRNGILLDKILNQHGVIQIGKHILRYQNGNTFYIDANDASGKTISSKMQFGELSKKFKSASSLIENLTNKNNTYARAVDGLITNPQTGQQYNYELAYQEDNINAKYRYRTWLFESHIVYPTGRTDIYGNPIWSTNYRVYFQFSLQKNLIGIWVTAGEFANLMAFHVESKIGTYNKSGFVYCPGTIIYGNQTLPVNDNTTPFNHTIISTTSTALGAFPTMEVYKTNTNVDMLDLLGLPRLPGQVPYYTARIKINIEHNRGFLPNKYFYYEYQP